jgi:acyl-CoA synthetase (AMP-forming)/AMP-acid ligase II
MPVKTPAPPQANFFVSAVVIIIAAIAAIFVLRISPLSSPWAQGYDPTGHWWFSTILAALPIVVLLGSLAIGHVKAHYAALAGLAAALLTAIFGFHMPARVPEFQSYDELTLRASDAEPPQAEIVDNDPYNIIYSSGTTGSPKGIVLTHYIRAIYCALFASTFRMSPESVVLHSGSIVFNRAFLTLMPSMYLGAKYVLQKSFEPRRFVETVEGEGVTHVMMVPSQIVALLGSPHFSPEALKSLEMIGTVGAPLHMEHKEKLNRCLPDRFYELYGLTEGFMTVLDKNHYASKSPSEGPPQPFFEMRILNEQGKEASPGEIGEIVGRGPALMPGYYKRPDLTAQAIINGWLHTGDLGYVDEEGFLYLVDRKKDMIISGGTNVFPKDIEEIIVQHPAVCEAAVFGIPSDKWGETPLTAVIPHQPGAVAAEALCDWINEAR